MASHLKRKRHQKSSTSRKSSSTSNFQDFTPESKPRKNSGKPGPTLAVNSILQELLGSSAGPSSTAYKRANNEANQGLRSSSRSHVVKAAKTKAARLQAVNSQFLASEILVIPCGTKQAKKGSHSYIPLLTPILRDPQVPGVAKVQSLEVVELAITDYAAGIPIDKTWSFALFNSELRKLFPQLFVYFDALPKAPNPDYEDHQDDIYRYLPPYYLCVKENRRVVIVPGIEFPDGSSVARNARTNKRTSFQENTVILATHQSIPPSVLQEWAKSKGKGKARVLRTSGDSSEDDNNSETGSISGDSDSSSSLYSSDTSFSEPPRKIRSRRVSAGTEDDINPASGSELPSLNAIVDLTASDNEGAEAQSSGDFFSSLDDHIVVNPDLAPMELAPEPQVVPSSLTFDTDTVGEPVSPLKASGSFVIDPSLDDPWQANRRFDFY